MPFVPLDLVLPSLAKRETRFVEVPAKSVLPAGGYGFLESFCDEEGCDCRRAYIHVIGPLSTRGQPPPSPAALISYGWEDLAFYRDWATFPVSKRDLAELKGPALVTLMPQGPYAQALLELFKYLLLDKSYARRLVEHDRAFQAAVSAARAASPEGDVAQAPSAPIKLRRSKGPPRS